MNKHLSTAFLSLTLLVAATHAVAQSTDIVSTKPAVIKLGSGFDYSRGKYGFTQATEVLSIPVNASYEQDRWAFRASVPFITIKGPASVVAGQAPVAAPGRPVTQSESGLGDPTLSATFHAHPVPGEWNVDLTGRVKFGTADEAKGLGTGENDFYAQIDSYRTFGDITPFLSAGYRFLGSSTVYPLKDGLYASVGCSYRVVGTTVVGAAFDWRSKIIEGAKNGTDSIAFISTDLSAKWNFLGYVLVGFNDASPDFGIGSAATYKF